MSETQPTPRPSADPEPFERLVRRTEGLQPWRRVFHALNGVLLAFLPSALGLSRPLTLSLLGLGFLALLAGDLLRLRVEWMNRAFFTAFSSLASPREAAGPASSTWYMLGAFLAWALFPPEIAAASILVLGLADPAAGVVGRLFGRRPLGKGSVEGSLAFLTTAVLTLGLLVDWPAALFAGVMAAAFEIVPGLVDDNLVVPVVTGTALWIYQAAGFPL